ncbi:MAG TPA: hypothetical protein VFI65_24425 [Streptosporangiaceae bacterium]|nr:hypothetical protein [Streptosporangiaceae bacterium]
MPGTELEQIDRAGARASGAVGDVDAGPLAAEAGRGNALSAEAETKFPQLKLVGVTEATFHAPARLGRVASKVPVWLPGVLFLTAFQNTARPDEVTVASGSLAEKMCDWMMTGLPTTPAALIGVSATWNLPVPPEVHRTCSTPSLPRTRPTSSMFVSFPVTWVH